MIRRLQLLCVVACAASFRGAGAAQRTMPAKLYRVAWPAASAAIVLLLSFNVLAPAAEPPRPNIILILVDDMGYGDIGPFGSKLNRTPCLDRMAAEGMKLTSFYAVPVCTPSRAQMMTGCYAKRVSLPNVLFPKHRGKGEEKGSEEKGSELFSK